METEGGVEEEVRKGKGMEEGGMEGWSGVGRGRRVRPTVGRGGGGGRSRGGEGWSGVSAEVGREGCHFSKVCSDSFRQLCLSKGGERESVRWSTRFTVTESA